MKYKVYAIQGMRFNEIEVEANSKEEAKEIYNAKWNKGAEIYSVDYNEDDVRYMVEEVAMYPDCGCATDWEHDQHTVICDHCDSKVDDGEITEIEGKWTCDECYSKLYL